MALPSSQSVSQQLRPLGYMQRTRHPFLEISLKTPAKTPPIMAIIARTQAPSVLFILTSQFSLQEEKNVPSFL